MLIIRDTTGITVKRRIQDENHVRLGIFEIRLWKNGKSRNHHKLNKPHNEYTVNELSDLLTELERP